MDKGKKKVLIAVPNPLNHVGGVEVYCKSIIPLFLEKKWDVTVITICYHGDEIKEFPKEYKLVVTKDKFNNASGINYWPRYKLVLKQLNNFKKKEKFDLIINNFAHGFKWEYIPKNEILIQHQTPIFYEYAITHTWSKIISKFFYFFSNRLLGLGNLMKTHKNVIFYNKENFANAENCFKMQYSSLPCVNLYACKSSIINKIKYTEKQKKIVYIGRIEPFQKKIKFLIKVAKYLNYQIDVYGTGPLINLVKTAKNIKYCGVLKREDVIPTYSKYLASINVSKFEGACFSAIEGIAAGTPTIVRDTFCSAKELASTGLLLDKKLSPKQCAKRINEYLDKLDSKKAFKECQELALKNYTEEVFTKKWNDIIKNYEHYLHT